MKQVRSNLTGSNTTSAFNECHFLWVRRWGFHSLPPRLELSVGQLADSPGTISIGKLGLKLLILTFRKPCGPGPCIRILDSSVTCKVSLFIYKKVKREANLESWACSTEIHCTRISDPLPSPAPAWRQPADKQVSFLIHEMRWVIILPSHINPQYFFPRQMPDPKCYTNRCQRKGGVCSKVSVYSSENTF